MATAAPSVATCTPLLVGGPDMGLAERLPIGMFLVWLATGGVR